MEILTALPGAVGVGLAGYLGMHMARQITLGAHNRRIRRTHRVFRLILPPMYQPSARATEALVTALASKYGRSWWSAWFYGQPRLVFEVRADDRGVQHCWILPADELKFVRQLLETHYPGVAYEEIEDYLTAPASPSTPAVATGWVHLARPAAYPIGDYTADFGTSLTAVLEGCRDQGSITVQVVMRPLRKAEWVQAARQVLLRSEGKAEAANPADRLNRALIAGVESLWGGGARASPSQQPTAPVVSRLERAETKETPAKLMATPALDCSVRVMATATTRREATSLANRVGALFALLAGANQLIYRTHGWWIRSRSVYQDWARRSSPNAVSPRSVILSIPEVLSLVTPHPVRAADDAKVRIIELARAPLEEGIHLVDAQYRGRRVQVRVNMSDLHTHLGIQGKSGNGKGVIQEHLFREVARLGYGGAYIDPLGGSVRKILASLPEDRLKDVIYIEAGHPRWAPGLNLLACDSPEEQETIVTAAVSLYYRLWSDAWGKSTEEMLRAATIAVLQTGGALPEAELVLSSPEYRAKILPRITGPIRTFLENLPDKVTESLRPPLNKLHELLWQPSLLAMIGQTQTLNWREIITGRKLLLVNCNKGHGAIGELGARLISGIVWDRLSRALLSIPVPDRIPFMLIADEFRDVAARSAEQVEEAFSQWRQFLGSVVAAGQYPTQLPEKVWGALSGNVGSKLVLREDAEHAAACIRFVGAQGVLEEQDLANLPKLTGFANLTMGDRPTGLFTAWAPPYSQTLRDPDVTAEEILSRCARPREEVLAEIDRRIQAASGPASRNRVT